MTTGRINQVTILNQSTKRTLADPPKRANITKQGDAEAIQVAALEASKIPTAQATDSIAPTEFPRRWSATSHDRCCHRIHFRCIHPPGGENLRLVTHWMRKLGKMVPKDLVNIWHSQQSTDPKWCPTIAWWGFGSHCAIRCGAKRHLLNIGVSQPKQAEESCRALDGALQEYYRPQPLSRKQGKPLRNM
jgi:hypothetical protein